MAAERDGQVRRDHELQDGGAFLPDEEFASKPPEQVTRAVAAYIAERLVDALRPNLGREKNLHLDDVHVVLLIDDAGSFPRHAHSNWAKTAWREQERASKKTHLNPAKKASTHSEC